MQKSGKVKSQDGAETPPAYELDAQVGFLLRIAMQRHTAIFMSNMTDELTPTQFAVLAKLHEVGPSSQNHLGRLVYLDAATIKGVVDRLALRGLVSTNTDPDDRRRRAVALTEKGSGVVEGAIRVAADVTAKTLRPLSMDEQRTLTRLLRKIT